MNCNFCVSLRIIYTLILNEAMRNLRFIVIVLVLIGMSVPAMLLGANPQRRYRIVGADRPNSSGLYGRKGWATGENVSLQLNGLYYYGDAGMRRGTEKTPFLEENIGVSGAVSYSRPFAAHFRWRVSLSIGMLTGDDSRLYPDNHRKFNSIFVEPAIGVQYYPFTKAGFYLFAGISLPNSFVKYDYLGVQGRIYGIVPMIPLELGYDIPLGSNWALSINVAVHQALLDVPICNLDGYPQKGSLNDANLSFGLSDQNKFADGYFQVGISVLYSFGLCEPCRVYKW